MEYEKRIVCFMDLLGFKNMVYDSSDNVDIRDRIFTLLQNVKEINYNFQGSRDFMVIPEKDLKDGFSPKNKIDSGLQSEMSFFSDSIIFSYKLTQARNDLMDVIVALHEISSFVFQVLAMGVFIRGGLSFGDVYHRDNVCFGPALVKAVSLEGMAVYPRISIDPLFFNCQSPNSVYFGKTAIIGRNRDYLEDTYHCVDIKDIQLSNKNDIQRIRLNKSLVHYLDFLDININYDKTTALHIKSVIENELKKDYPPHIAEKYAWMKDYFNSIVWNVQCMDGVQIEI